jgi:hypothetical protein
MEEEKEIPVLISAAAVQITLGLEKYELPFFKNIYVTPMHTGKRGNRRPSDPSLPAL